MPRNTSGLMKGRPKGAKNLVPPSFKQALRAVFEEIHDDTPALIRRAVERDVGALYRLDA